MAISLIAAFQYIIGTLTRIRYCAIFHYFNKFSKIFKFIKCKKYANNEIKFLAKYVYN